MPCNNAYANTSSAAPVVRPLSLVLEELRDSLRGHDSVTIRMLAEGLHERGLGAMVLVFAVPLALPTGILPGANTIFALPLLPLTAQQAMGRHTIWLPEKILAKTLSQDTLSGMIGALTPWLKKMEKFVKPRLAWVTHGAMSQFFGLCSLIMALVAAVPLPLTHTVPGIGIAVMALGTTTRDGLAVIAGALFGMGWIIMLATALIIFGPEAFGIIKHAILSVI